MSSQSTAVGFQFQGDVFGGGSLTWQATGRLFKALSDGGIDPYSVSALVQLGKGVQVSEKLRLSIGHLVRSRSNRSSFISKALWLGWGHTEIAYELAKTQAGLSALALIAAFSAGTSDFEASRSLVALMGEFGCEADMLPSVEALRPAVSFFAPIVRDCGVAEVLGQVKRQCEVQMSPSQCSDGLNVGDPHVWANTLKLIFSAYAQGVNLTICAQQRAFWFAAFAARILGMATVVQMSPSGPALWQCAGDGPSLTIYLERQHQYYANTVFLERSSMISGRAPLDTFCTGRDYFPSLLTSFCKLHVPTAHSFPFSLGSHEVVSTGEVCAQWTGRLCAMILGGARLKSLASLGRVTRESLLTIAVDLSVPGESFSQGFDDGNINFVIPSALESFMKSQEELKVLASFFAATTLALSFCRVDLDNIMFYERWDDLPSQSMRLRSQFQSLCQARNNFNGEATVSFEMILEHLTTLCGGPEVEYLEGAIAFSAYDFAIYPSLLIDDDPDTFMSRPFVINKGRLNYEGSFRSFVAEPVARRRATFRPLPLANKQINAELMKWPSDTLSPQYRPGPNYIDVRAALSSDHISLDLVTCSRDWSAQEQIHLSGDYALNLLDAHQRACYIPRGDSCAHRKDRTCRLQDISDNIVVASFGKVKCFKPLDFKPDHRVQSVLKTLLIGLSGAPLEQLFQAVSFTSVEITPLKDDPKPSPSIDFSETVMFQGDACLECALYQARNLDIYTIIMQ